ncbi:MAG: hypothetical protein LBP64_00765 [Tannerella sp.]|jgi:hypothetical protein|nr:hypothetical protein [Tannerella sp.]
MLDLLRDILKSDAGSFGFVIALFGLIIYAVYYVTRFTTKISVEHDGTEKRANRIEEAIDKLKDSVVLIKGDLTGIKEQLNRMSNNRAGNNPFTLSQSPVALTQTGKEMAGRLQIARRMAANWSRIYAAIETKVKDKNPYDIQQFCIERATVNLSDFFTEEDVREIKQVAFEEGVSVELFGSLIGVMVRDAYFKEKGINTNEADAHTPH